MSDCKTCTDKRIVLNLGDNDVCPDCKGGGELYALYDLLRSKLAKRECESCGESAHHVYPDGSTWCHECAYDDEEGTERADGGELL